MVYELNSVKNGVVLLDLEGCLSKKGESATKFSVNSIKDKNSKTLIGNEIFSLGFFKSKPLLYVYIKNNRLNIFIDNNQILIDDLYEMTEHHTLYKYTSDYKNKVKENVIGAIVTVKGLPGKSKVLDFGKDDFFIRWIDDSDKEKFECFVPKSDVEF